MLTLLLSVVMGMAALGARADAVLDARLKALENELRCLVCQNQTLAESNAPLAEDLRKEVRELAVAGKTDDDIRAYLVARYGDFVLYKPPVKATTYLLWFGPFVLLAAGIAVWIAVLRRRARMPASDSSDEALAVTDADAGSRARALLED
ncbi:MAG TPA: cytochrome c-type biogenesis protein [Casimicrobiaceae bacterium]|nr:cytochrome c-type biogenesis protein [Casimicrobiaceae bacterium]